MQKLFQKYLFWLNETEKDFFFLRTKVNQSSTVNQRRDIIATLQVNLFLNTNIVLVVRELSHNSCLSFVKLSKWKHILIIMLPCLCHDNFAQTWCWWNKCLSKSQCSHILINYVIMAAEFYHSVVENTRHEARLPRKWQIIRCRRFSLRPQWPFCVYHTSQTTILCQRFVIVGARLTKLFSTIVFQQQKKKIALWTRRYPQNVI